MPVPGLEVDISPALGRASLMSVGGAFRSKARGSLSCSCWSQSLVLGCCGLLTGGFQLSVWCGVY